MFGKRKLNDAWVKGYSRGYAKGSREMSQFVREMIIKNLLADAVIITNADVRFVERVVKIIEES
jgi:cobalamin biosynthesis Mg chelatase CobN